MQNETAEPEEPRAKKELSSVGEKEAERRTGSCRDSNPFLASLFQGRVLPGREYDAERQRGREWSKKGEDGHGRAAVLERKTGGGIHSKGETDMQKEREISCLFTVTKRSTC